MATEDSADAIRRRMAELRRELTYDVRDVGRSARAMASPAFYVRKFPWATTAVAAAIGYLLIPKQKQIVQPDPEMLAELVRKNQVRVDASAAAKDRQGMLQSLVVMGVTWAAKAGLNHMMQRMTIPAASKGNAAEAAPSAPAEESWKAKR